MIWFFILLNFFGCLNILVAQNEVECNNSRIDFGNKEILNYKVSYNFGIIWIDAGFVDFMATKQTLNGYETYQFTSTGISEKKWEWIYKVRDTFQVISNAKNLYPIEFRRSTLEGGIYNMDQYSFDNDKNVVYAKMRDNNSEYKFDSISISDCTYDILTATYVARSMDFSNNWVGDTIMIKLIHDGRLFKLPIVYHGKEIMEGMNNSPVICTKFSAIIDKGTMFRSGEKITIWVTDDKYKIPVLIDAKIVVGSIKVYLINKNIGD